MPLDRRTALRAAAAAAIGISGASGCDSRKPPPAGRSAAPGSSTPSPPSGAASAPAGRAALPPEIDSGPRDRPNVALTFHGQGDPAQARQLLDVLEHSGARVTVLAVGNWLASHPEMAARILDRGHELGNHTENHLDISRMSATEAFGEIDSCARRIKSLTGTIGSWFRPSQTQHANALIRDQAARVGYPTCVSYDVDSRDYTDPGSSAVVETTLRLVRPGSIVSLHFGHQDTLAAVGPILDGLRQRGLHAVTMKDLMG